MLVYVDIVSGKEVCTDSYPSQTKVDGAVMVVESKRVTRQDAEVDIGANASAEGADEDEKVESSGPKTVINIVDAHQLTKTELNAKEFKATLKTFWKALVTKLGSRKNAILFDDADYKAPEDKAAAKAAEAEAREELDASKKAELDAEDKRLATFKKNFEAIQKFIKDEIEANFAEFEFYYPEGTDLGESLIIPARYVGEATAPTFYYFNDALEETKF